MNLSYPCYVVAGQAILSSNVAKVVWPFHTTPLGTASFDVTLTNTGSANAVCNRTVSPAAPWLSFTPNTNPITVAAGCPPSNSQTIQITATGPATEGVYKTTVTWAFAKGAVPLEVELYNFTNWFMEADQDIYTATARMAVNQNSRVGAQRTTHSFSYVSEAPTRPDYFFDGSLLIGTSATKLSMGAFADSAGFIGAGDPAIGRLFCLSDLQKDSIPNGATPTAPVIAIRGAVAATATRASALTLTTILRGGLTAVTS